MSTTNEPESELVTKKTLHLFAGRANLPLAPGYHPAGVIVRLTPFTRETLDHFIFLERADHHRLQDAPGFEPVEPDLEDVYFSTMAGHIGRRRGQPEVAA